MVLHHVQRPHALALFPTAAVAVALVLAASTKHPAATFLLTSLPAFPLLEVPEAAPVAALSLPVLPEPSAVLSAPAFVASIVATSRFKSLEALRSLAEVSPSAPLAEGLLSTVLSLPSSSPALAALSLLLGAGSGILHPDHLAVDAFAVEGGDGSVGLALGGQLDEAENAAVVEGLEEDVDDTAALAEEGIEVFLGGLGGEGGTLGVRLETKRRLEGSWGCRCRARDRWRRICCDFCSAF
jgi:hypothetical protein